MKQFCCPLAVPGMADSSKRKIYQLLAAGEKTVSQLTRALKLRQPTVSYHLKKMREKGLVRARKKGREVFYRINKVCPEGRVCY